MLFLLLLLIYILFLNYYHEKFQIAFLHLQKKIYIYLFDLLMLKLEKISFDKVIINLVSLLNVLLYLIILFLFLNVQIFYLLMILLFLLSHLLCHKMKGEGFFSLLRSLNIPFDILVFRLIIFLSLALKKSEYFLLFKFFI